MKKLLSQNDKLKKTSKITGIKTFDFAIPAIKTCPFADACKKYCYANKGAYKWPVVKNKLQWNFKQTKLKSFVKKINAEIKKHNIKAIRIHSSGDFYSKDYLNKWIEIIRENPTVIFYAYTKSIPYFKSLFNIKKGFENDKLPKNFKVIYSYGGLKDSLIKNSDRHAKVFNEGDIKKSYAYTGDNDHIALGRNKKIGLIKH